MAARQGLMKLVLSRVEPQGALVVTGLVIENTTFEKHYRISDLARLWGGPGDRSQARQRRSRRSQDSDGTEEDTYYLQRS